MKIIQLIHNPSAGKQDHSRDSLMERLKREDYLVKYVSTEDENWEDFINNKPEVIYVAGGDGTVHKVASVLVETEYTEAPVHIIPLGTANNIALSLPVTFPSHNELFMQRQLRDLDYGVTTGINGDTYFFESAGIGLFPALMKEIKERKKKLSPEDELQWILEVLLKISKDFKPFKAKLKFDGVRLEGSFLLIEVMNMQYLGPNLNFAPGADLSDGYFDLILIPEKRRPQLIKYLQKLIADEHSTEDLKSFLKNLKIKKVSLKSKASEMHIDDELILKDDVKLKFKMLQKPLKFFSTPEE